MKTTVSFWIAGPSRRQSDSRRPSPCPPPPGPAISSGRRHRPTAPAAGLTGALSLLGFAWLSAADFTSQMPTRTDDSARKLRCHTRAERSPASQPTAPAHHSDEAISRLRQQGRYQSLMQAARAARYAIQRPADHNPDGMRYYADNPAHGLRCRFDADGLDLRAGGTPWKLKLQLSGYGRKRIEAAEVDAVSEDGNRVELSRMGGAVIEWYENRPDGLEHGFVLQRPPPGRGRLRLALQVQGELTPELETPYRGDSPATTVSFVAPGNQVLLRYGGLKVWDAEERHLPAHLAVSGRQLMIIVDDRAAAYPVFIDPVFTRQEALLTQEDFAEGDRFANAVSLSADGNTALIGAYEDDRHGAFNAGSAYVFVFGDGTWNQQAHLSLSSAGNDDAFGHSVALSADGDTALIGASGPWDSLGHAYVFQRSGDTWTQQGQLTAADAAIGDQFGSSVSLSADGLIALIGAPYDDRPAGYDAGSAYVFVHSVSGWIQQAQLTPTDPAVHDLFGFVSISGDGNYALVGAPDANTPAGPSSGSAYVFRRSGATWTQQAKLTADDAEAGDHLGATVALSHYGSTALVGAPRPSTSTPSSGSAYVFVRGGHNIWGQEARLDADDVSSDEGYDLAVAVSADGATALIGNYGEDTPTGEDAGCAYVFTRSLYTRTWTKRARLTAADGAQGDGFGWAVSLSAAGDRALIGAIWDDTPAGVDAGSAYLFDGGGSSWSQQTQLTGADVSGGDRFGFSVSLDADGDTALVGAIYHDTYEGTHAGSAYVFVRNGTNWNQQAHLTADPAMSDDHFGSSVSLSANGDTALVGADHGDATSAAGAGTAFVFVRSDDSWTQQAWLTAPDAEFLDRFGRDVSLDALGNRALVGAPGDFRPEENDGGSAYVFRRSGSIWILESQLTATDNEAGKFFGWSVALNGDGSSALIGAPGDDTSAGVDAGSAYVFTRNASNWTQQVQLTADDADGGDSLGYSVSLDEHGSTALVGAPLNDTPAGVGAGSAYVFARTETNWFQQGHLTADDAGGGDLFGNSVSLSSDGDTALIGAPYDDTLAGTTAGSAYVFRRNFFSRTWSQRWQITAGDAEAGDWFGCSVSLGSDGNRALIGASRHDSPAGLDMGGSYVFRLDDVPLTITNNGNGTATLSWPTSASGYALEYNEALSYGNWEPVPGTPTSDGASYHVIVPVTAGNSKFYRLRR